MIIKNKLNKTFGPFGSSTGFFMVLWGIIATYYSLIGLVIALIGAFVSFTSESTFIDTDNKRIKFSNNLFGIIPSGTWIDIMPDMKIGVKKSRRGYLAYIMGTRPIGIHIKDFKIILYSSDNKQIMPIKNLGSYKTMQSELNELNTILNLEII